MENEETIEESEEIHEEIDESQIEQDDEGEESHLEGIPVHLQESYEISNSSNVSRNKYYKQTYRPAWEQMPDFKGWLRGVVGEPTRAYCQYCQKTLHAHRLSLLKHTCTIRHQKAAQICQNKQNRNMLPILGGVGLDDSEIHQIQQEEEVENDDADPIEYAEVTSEADDDEVRKEHDNEGVEEEEEEEVAMEIHQVSYDKRPVAKAPITTHVLDTTKGQAATGLQVSLYKLIDGRWTYINEGLTNASGRVQSFFERSEFTTGRYKLHYDVDRYFEARKQDSIYPFIEVVFDCRNPNESYHVPIVLSPFGYSTYKGL